ncbi:MAG: VCBS repeat-containing protein [Hormoscilla sp. GM7CHS1pb]|nr:VCBS repeat-containing protein [Hormoscilla sp. GM7CHS1pb]MBC6479407.1 VCBS repeat-containing protein [Hormoscilla sp. GM7CHS1pb]
MSTVTFGTLQYNPFGLRNVGQYSSPTLADIDGDGDLDLFLGNKNGKIIYFKNKGTASAPTFGTPKNNRFGLTAVNYSSKPTFADIDGDGDLDFFLGEYHGLIIYQENQGTASSTAFGRVQINPFGLADVGFDSSPTLADLDGDGLLDLLVGNSDGKIIYFKNKSLDIELSDSSISENSDEGAVVGTFSITDPNNEDTFTYQLVAGAGDTDNAAFTIDGDELQINSSPDFETQSSYSIRVQTTSTAGLSYSEIFTINVKDVNEDLLDSKDYQPMKALYEGTGGADWKKNRGWVDWDFKSKTPPKASIVAGWHGVRVSGNRVTGLFLSNNQLDGTIPKELGNLENLEWLVLSNNQLDGSIPKELGNLKNLVVLNLSNNFLTGNIITELGDLENLGWLSLYNNQLTGGIPTELGDLKKLTSLNLGQNQLTGGIPTNLGNLNNLILLSLFRNPLTGTIPTTLGNLVNLIDLRLSQNSLTGTIPTTLGNLVNLKGSPWTRTN